ncbi:MAG: hypothetical protein LUE31_03300, partial [Lachnospiraceae bacterium]|nr:hypothetical protein [Lachnospiraceae bacterium]
HCEVDEDFTGVVLCPGDWPEPERILSEGQTTDKEMMGALLCESRSAFLVQSHRHAGFRYGAAGQRNMREGLWEKTV